MIEKKETIAATMREFMATGPSVATYATYKSLNDAVGKIHGLKEGKCQALAGEKAWAWTADQATGTWRKATDVEIQARRTKAAKKNNGGTRKSKVLSDADRAALDAQVTALEAVANPALAPLLADLKAQQAADDAARKGSLKERLAKAVERLGLVQAVEVLEAVETEAVETEAVETEAVETEAVETEAKAKPAAVAAKAKPAAPAAKAAAAAQAAAAKESAAKAKAEAKAKPAAVAAEA